MPLSSSLSPWEVLAAFAAAFSLVYLLLALPAPFFWAWEKIRREELKSQSKEREP